jgi:hypothetical protein
MYLVKLVRSPARRVRSVFVLWLRPTSGLLSENRRQNYHIDNYLLNVVYKCITV